ncbi:MAG TPA: alcohol dehydrogenase catalytic domain-containing protein, partial [Roseiflexaceae bacterium]|nr:alcohol dehydrogenase catalytic domain-containing protein [Roseiflexaceae bacterium]
MQAITYRHYGAPDVLRLEAIAEPVPGPGDVMVRVHAASINAADAYLLRGEPPLLRLSAGLRRPKHPILGSDIAGQVVAVGNRVTQFQPGDEVYGDL